MSVCELWASGPSALTVPAAGTLTTLPATLDRTPSLSAFCSLGFLNSLYFQHITPCLLSCFPLRLTLALS